MYQGRTLQELAVELDRQNKMKRDFIVNTRTLRMSEDGSSVALKCGGMDESFGIKPNFHTQMGLAYKIPSKYYEKMQVECPELLATNINTWLGRDESKRMVRTLDGNARAFLSNKYRRIDNYEIANVVLPIISEMRGAKVESCEVTDDHLYIKVVNPRLEGEVNVGDAVQAGVIIRNSEVGLGSVYVAPLLYRLVCSNGMIVNDAKMRRYHVGRVNDEASELFADDTLAADDKALMLKLRDTVRAAVDEVQFEKILAIMREASDVKMHGNADVVVELTSKKFGIRDSEQGNVLNHLIAGGDLSLYGLSNAITRASQDVDTYNRATELESVGWDVLTMSESAWKEIDRQRRPSKKK